MALLDSMQCHQALFAIGQLFGSSLPLIKVEGSIPKKISLPLATIVESSKYPSIPKRLTAISDSIHSNCTLFTNKLAINFNIF